MPVESDVWGECVAVEGDCGFGPAAGEHARGGGGLVADGVDGDTIVVASVYARVYARVYVCVYLCVHVYVCVYVCMYYCAPVCLGTYL